VVLVEPLCFGYWLVLFVRPASSSLTTTSSYLAMSLSSVATTPLSFYERATTRLFITHHVVAVARCSCYMQALKEENQLLQNKLETARQMANRFQTTMQNANEVSASETLLLTAVYDCLLLKHLWSTMFSYS
jgi:hypothetical protein